MEEESRALKYWDRVVQVCLPIFTIGGFLLISLRLPQWGVASNLFSQIFWFSASYKAWKKGGQWGLLVTTAVTTLIFAYGVVNYWFL